MLRPVRVLLDAVLEHPPPAPFPQVLRPVRVLLEAVLERHRAEQDASTRAEAAVFTTREEEPEGAPLGGSGEAPAAEGADRSGEGAASAVAGGAPSYVDGGRAPGQAGEGQGPEEEIEGDFDLQFDDDDS